MGILYVATTFNQSGIDSYKDFARKLSEYLFVHLR